MSKILHIKETVRSNTQHLATDIKSPAQQEIRDLAIDRCLERFCPGGCERQDQRKSFEKAVGMEAKEIAKQKELETVQKQVLEQQKSWKKRSQ